MRETGRFVLALLLYFSAVGSALAGQTLPETQSETQSIPLTTTDFNSALVFNKFAPSLGTLTGVSVTLNGHLDGTGRFENGANAPATISLHLEATIALTRPDGSQIVNTVPVVNTSDDVSAFDGIRDFGGTSGRIHNNLIGNAETEISLTSPADLALFLGPGQISLPVSAMAQSSAFGSGNLLTSFSTKASAMGTIEYTFTASPLIPPSPQVVPEPTTLGAAGGGGLILFMALCRRRTRTPPIT